MDPDPSSPQRGEFAAIAHWLETLATDGPRIAVGPGDDAAWLNWHGRLAVSTDSFVEDVHFRRSWAPPEKIAQRGLAAALSDLAASRARPLACVVALSSPSFDPWCDSLMAGLAEAAERWGCPVVGGDTTRSPGPVFLNFTVLGEATGRGPLLRSGAQVGDLLQISGLPGASARAVEQLLAGNPVPWPSVRPRLDLLETLGEATAGIDLLADAAHLAKASGLGLKIDRDEGWDVHVLTGGEDYELLVTAPTALEGFEVIGSVVQGAGIAFSDGGELPPKPWGFQHAAKEDRC